MSTQRSLAKNIESWLAMILGHRDFGPFTHDIRVES